MVIISGKTKKELYKSVHKVLSCLVELLRGQRSKIEFQKIAPLDFEKVVCKGMQKIALLENLDVDVQLISGQTFPDIICKNEVGNIVGVEIKCTKSDKWICIGNSINESTRVDGIDHLFVLFGKLGGEPDFRFANYDEVMSEIKVTHSPRYYIDMDCSDKNTIFSKMDVKYNEFRQDDDRFKVLKRYYRSFLKEGQELWWIDNEQDDSFDIDKQTIRLWSEAEETEKENIIADAFILFLELFRTGGSNKYNRLASWMVSSFNLVSPSLRDSFSAGGRADISGFSFPRVVQKLIDNYENAESRISAFDREDLAHYWKLDVDKIPKRKKRIFEYWQTMVMNTLSQNIDSKGISILRKALLED